MLFQSEIIVTVNIGRVCVWYDNPFIFWNPTIITRVIFAKIAFITDKIAGINLIGKDLFYSRVRLGVGTFSCCVTVFFFDGQAFGKWEPACR